MPKLELRLEGNLLREISLTAGVFSIGRAPDNDIHLDDQSVSGKHARIVVTPNEYMQGLLDVAVMDMGSTNGTLVNDKPVRGQRLKNGDRIQIGMHELAYRDNDSGELETTRVILRTP